MNRSILIATVCCFSFGCSAERVSTTVAEGGRYYSTSFPGPGRDDLLAEVLPAARMISSVGFYRQANFSSSDGWPADRPITDRIWREADTVTTFTQSVVGTATILQFSTNRVALLTAAHIVTFDDTVTTYYRDRERPTGIRAFAVKVRQRNYAADIPGADGLEVLARNDRLDIAIVGQAINTLDMTFPVFPLPAGRAADLNWGSFVYVVGYPVGLRMVSSGIVSQPNRDGDASFLTDVVFNRGMSGGAVLASRSRGGPLEWVGIVTSGSANTEYDLVPEDDRMDENRVSGEPYEGQIYINRTQRIRYGVTMAVSIDAIRKLVGDNRTSLLRRGYHINIFE